MTILQQIKEQYSKINTAKNYTEELQIVQKIAELQKIIKCTAKRDTVYYLGYDEYYLNGYVIEHLNENKAWSITLDGEWCNSFQTKWDAISWIKGE